MADGKWIIVDEIFLEIVIDKNDFIKSNNKFRNINGII